MVRMESPEAKRRKWGQFYTAPEVADLILGFCLRQPTDRLLDPSCGQGAFLLRAARYQRWLATSGQAGAAGSLWGVEIDIESAAMAREALSKADLDATILVRDFFSLLPRDGEDVSPGGGLPGVFNCIVGNPPYTRSEWLGKVNDDAGYKETLARKVVTGPDGDLAQLSLRAGLHAYFVVHAAKFLRPYGRFGFVVSNSWLDVGYGVGLKAFLLDSFKIVAVIESAVERWFSEAEVNTCLLILEKCPDQAARTLNQVRFVRLHRLLRELIPSHPDDRRRAVEVETLLMRLLPGRSRLAGDVTVRVVPQAGLDPKRKWGPYLRAPEVYFQTRGGPGTVRLGEIAELHRGLTTGANGFFYLSPEIVDRWGIETKFTQRLLKSPREVERVRMPADALSHRVLMVHQEPTTLKGTNVQRYIEWGESQNYHRRSTCARRPLWYSLSESRWAADSSEETGQLVWIKGIWNRHFAPLVEGQALADQQFYLIDAQPEMAEVLAALLNSTWVALQAELAGRSNFGEGVLWLAVYEVLDLQLPDPQILLPADRHALREALAEVALRPVLPLVEQVSQPGQRRLDALVFDVLGLPPGERDAVVEAAVELTEARLERARSNRAG